MKNKIISDIERITDITTHRIASVRERLPILADISRNYEVYISIEDVEDPAVGQTMAQRIGIETDRMYKFVENMLIVARGQQL